MSENFPLRTAGIYFFVSFFGFIVPSTEYTRARARVRTVAGFFFTFAFFFLNISEHADGEHRGTRVDPKVSNDASHPTFRMRPSDPI